MIHLTKINSEEIVLNSDLIEMIESVPDTMIVLVSGDRVFVQECPEEVVSRVVDFRRRILNGVVSSQAGFIPCGYGGTGI